MYKNQSFLLLFLLLSGFSTAQAQTDIQQSRIAVIIPEFHLSAPMQNLMQEPTTSKSTSGKQKSSPTDLSAATSIDRNTYAVPVKIPDPAGETAIIRKLLEAGFTRVVDQVQVEKIRDSDVVKQLVSGDSEAAIDIGLQLGVDIIIIGEAFSELAGRLPGGLISCRARVETRAVMTDNGRILTASGFHAGGVDLTEATAAKTSLNNAGEMTGDYIVEQFLKHGGGGASGVKLTVSGISSYSRLTELEKALRGLKGVENVRINEYVGGVATLDLDVAVPVKTLATMISGISVPRLEVTEISGSAIKASMR